MPNNEPLESKDELRLKAWLAWWKKMARPHCQDCAGFGINDKLICACAFRRIFKRCLNEYHHKKSAQASLHSVVQEEIKGRLCSRPVEEYIADFEMVCRRAARELGTAYEILLDQYLVGDLPLSPVMQEQLTARLGEALCATQPYSLVMNYGSPLGRPSPVLCRAERVATPKGKKLDNSRIWFAKQLT
jgi:hypothetical protein